MCCHAARTAVTLAALLPCEANEVASKSWVHAQLSPHESHDPVRIDGSWKGEGFAKFRREGVAPVMLATCRRKPGTEQRHSVSANLDRIPHPHEQVDRDVARLDPLCDVQLHWRIAQPVACHGFGDTTHVVGNGHATNEVLPRTSVRDGTQDAGRARGGAECDGSEGVAHVPVLKGRREGGVHPCRSCGCPSPDSPSG